MSARTFEKRRSFTKDSCTYRLTRDDSNAALVIVMALRHLEARLQALDISGRMALVRDLGDFGAGVHRLALDAGLSPGVYLIRVTQDGRSSSAMSDQAAGTSWPKSNGTPARERYWEVATCSPPATPSQ